MNSSNLTYHGPEGITVPSKDKQVLLVVEYPLFPTHIKLSDKQRAKKKIVRDYDKDTNTVTETEVVTNAGKVGKPRWEKINGQKIYDNTWSPHVRGKVIEEMHDFLQKALTKFKNPMLEGELRLCLSVYTVRNYNTVRMLDGKYTKVNEKEYAKWDLFNLFTILWIKTFEDSLTICKIIADDSVDFLRSTGETEVFFVKTMEERKLIFTVYKHA